MAAEGVASLVVADDRPSTEAPPTAPGVSEASPSVTPAAAAEEEEGRDEVHSLMRLHSTPDVTVRQHHYHIHHQQRSYSTANETFSTDVGGVSARSAPDSAIPLRQPEVGQSGQGGQRSRFQRFFEPLKRSKSTGNHKEAIAAAQASLYDPTRQPFPVGI